MQIVINDQMVRYDIYGTENSDVLLMLHGWGDRATGLRNVATVVASYGFRVVVPDLPGFGESDAPQEPWGLDEYARWVSYFLQKLEIHPSVIIGHSNGGAIVIRALANNTIHSDKLVLLACAGVRSSYQGRKKALRIVAKSAKLATAILPTKTRLKLRKRAYGAIGSDMFVAEHMQETFKKVIADDVQVDATKIIIPTLLIYGDKDTATPVEYGQLFTDAIPNASLLIIPEAGHFVHIDASEAVTNAIKKFIA